MASKSVELRDAIADLLNDDDNDFAMAFEALPRTAPLTETEVGELQTVGVYVFTGSVKAVRVQRRRFERTYKPVIAVYHPLNRPNETLNLELTNQLQELIEQIEAVVEDSDLADLSFVGFDEEEDREPYNAEAARTLSFFASAITLEYTSG